MRLLLFALVVLLAFGCISKYAEQPPPEADTPVPGPSTQEPDDTANEEPPSEAETPEEGPPPDSWEQHVGDITEPLCGSDATCDGITQQMCEGAGGHWNACGSACRGDPEATVCIAVCVPYCECGGIAGFGCPAGFVCTDYLPEGAADAMGICKKVSE